METTTNNLVLTKLPYKIREQIYGLLLVNQSLELDPVSRQLGKLDYIKYDLHPQIIATCKDVRKDVYGILYGKNKFRLQTSAPDEPNSYWKRHLPSMKVLHVIHDAPQVDVLHWLSRAIRNGRPYLNHLTLTIYGNENTTNKSFLLAIETLARMSIKESIEVINHGSGFGPCLPIDKTHPFRRYYIPRQLSRLAGRKGWTIATERSERTRAVNGWRRTWVLKPTGRGSGARERRAQYFDKSAKYCTCQMHVTNWQWQQRNPRPSESWRLQRSRQLFVPSPLANESMRPRIEMPVMDFWHGGIQRPEANVMENPSADRAILMPSPLASELVAPRTEMPVRS